METTITGTAKYTSYRVPATGDPHRVTRTVGVFVRIPHASALQAPVAALIPGSSHYRLSFPQAMAEIRTFEGGLYQQLLDFNRQPVTPASREFNTDFGERLNANDARDAVREGLGQLILVEGELWKRTEEPVIEVGQISTTIVPGPSDRGAWQVFALTEYDAAVAAGIAMDADEARSGRKPRPPAEVFIPSVFAMRTSAERVDDARAAAEAEVARAQRILSTGTAKAMNRASRILMKAANELARQTGEGSYSDLD